MHTFLKIKKPSHPLVSVVNFKDIERLSSEVNRTFIYNFYAIYLKKNFDGTLKYGQQYYDFNNGIMTFFAPKQKLTVEVRNVSEIERWVLFFYSDFIQNHEIGKQIKKYGFFSYTVNEALYLSDKEVNFLSMLVHNLQQEIETMIDNYTQDVVVSHIELLLNYCNRFYNRQFFTRKKASNDLFLKFEVLLMTHFQNEISDLPSVQYFAEKLAVSPNYLNDMLKNLIGLTTQKHIQNQ